MREREIEKEVCAWAKAHGILPIKFTPMGEVGWPDHIFLYGGGQVRFIEFKATGRGVDPRSLQAERIKELRRRGYRVGVVNDIQQGITFLGA